MGIVTEDSAPGPIEAMEEEWDEERINFSLSLLQEMHIQVDILHAYIPGSSLDEVPSFETSAKPSRL